MELRNFLSLTLSVSNAKFESSVSSHQIGLLTMCLEREAFLPRYDYECQTCKHRFEVRQSFSSEPVATCPVCQNGSRRIIHSVPVVFKGSGFYVNDYGKGRGSSNSAASRRESDSDKSSKSESKAESDSSSKGKPDKEPTAKS